MSTIQFILESNSNKKLDALAKEIIFSIKTTGATKSGPIAFKNKRMIYAYNCNRRTLEKLIRLDDKLCKGVDMTINPL
jgi:ribosomal protein S10